MRTSAPPAQSIVVSQRVRRILKFLVVAAAFLLVVKHCYTDDAVRLATFNIEDFPSSETQIEGAFAAISTLEADVVALQEIRDVETFRREARKRLGASWRTAWAETEVRHIPGVAFDTEAYRLESRTTHRDTVVCRGCRPVLEATLEPASEEGPSLSVFIVHLKAHDDGLEIRREQYRALGNVLESQSDDEGRIAVLGDFNSTTETDDELLSGLADRAGLRWTTRRADCTGYWKPDERCRGTVLDHILVEGSAPASVAGGPCQSVGCDPGASCPVFFHRVSDHCPVRVTLPE